MRRPYPTIAEQALIEPMSFGPRPSYTFDPDPRGDREHGLSPERDY
jgi:hypothetical protein